MGFTFDDTDTKGVATPIGEMHRLVERDPRNADRIFPYIGGEEVNDSPTHSHNRYVINFGEMTEKEARRWPDLVSILEAKVKPDRLTKDAKKYPRMALEWWKFWNFRVELYEAIHGHDRVLACSRHQPHWTITFLPAGIVFSEALNVFAFDDYRCFGLLQSRLHEVWVRFFASSLEDRLRYTPSDCFDTFPFAQGIEANAKMENSGRDYYECRAALMVRNNEGLTKTYNRFHDPNETSPDILKLRELHAAMDRAVLDAYGWTDLKPTCEFLLDYEEEDEDDNGAASKRKKPWRYRWPDEFRDEVLARLLELNKQRAEEEAIAGIAAEAAAKATGKRLVRRKVRNPQDGGNDRTLFR